jgi:hypothetical protein
MAQRHSRTRVDIELLAEGLRGPVSHAENSSTRLCDFFERNGHGMGKSVRMNLPQLCQTRFQLESNRMSKLTSKRIKEHYQLCQLRSDKNDLNGKLF